MPRGAARRGRSRRSSGPLLGALVAKPTLRLAVRVRVPAGAALLGIHGLFAMLATRTSFFGPLVKGEPRVLIKDGEVQAQEMRAAKLSDQDLAQALRLRSRRDDPSRIKRAYLERNGSISVVPFDSEPQVLDVAVEHGVQTVRIKLE